MNDLQRLEIAVEEALKLWKIYAILNGDVLRRQMIAQGRQEMTTENWQDAICPICGGKFKYKKGGYRAMTCNRFDCVHQYAHPQVYQQRRMRNGKQGRE